MTEVQERYTHGHHESVLKSHSWRTVENSAAYLIPELIVGRSLLDVGCGPGTITVDFARRLLPARVVGLDASPEVIEKAATLAEQQGLETVEFIVGNAYALPFPDSSFDIVHAHQTLQHVAKPVAVLREMMRVVKPGGIVAARDVDFAGFLIFPKLPGLETWLSLNDSVARSNGGEPDAGRRLKSWAMEAGFKEVEAKASVWCFSTDAEREWWGSMWEARVLQSAFAGDAISKNLATQSVLEEISVSWREWINAADGWMALPHGEILCRK